MTVELLEWLWDKFFGLRFFGCWVLDYGWRSLSVEVAKCLISDMLTPRTADLKT
jgi:hypothetical protein